MYKIFTLTVHAINNVKSITMPFLPFTQKSSFYSEVKAT